MNQRNTLGIIYMISLCFTCWNGYSQGGERDLPYREEPIAFQYEGQMISGQLMVPAATTQMNWPVIVFVHGSGPEDYSSSGNYTYLWEQFTKAGYACYSWDRPGVGKSEGKWYEMGIADRAGEVLSAVNKLKTVASIDPERIGFWGLSQAGWVVSEVSRDFMPSFWISVSSPLTTIAEQELHRVASEMRAEDFSEQEIRQAVTYTENYLDLVRKNRPYPEFAALQEGIKDARWSSHIIMGDEVVYSYLQMLISQDRVPNYTLSCPVLAIWGANDLIVPPQESAAAFKLRMEEAGNTNCTIAIISHADHTLTYNSSGRRAETMKRREEYSHQPAKQFAPGYVATMTGWLMALD